MTFSLIGIIGIVTGLQLFLLSFFLLGYKRGRTLSYRLLAAIVFCHALFIANFVLYHLRDYVFSTFPHAYHVGTSFLFAYAPLIYLYTRSLSDHNDKELGSGRFQTGMISIGLLISVHSR